MELSEDKPSVALVKRGGATVRFYTVIKPNGYTSHQVADYSAGQRKFKSVSNLAEAKREGGIIGVPTDVPLAGSWPEARPRCWPFCAAARRPGRNCFRQLP